MSVLSVLCPHIQVRYAVSWLYSCCPRVVSRTSYLQRPDCMLELTSDWSQRFLSPIYMLLQHPGIAEVSQCNIAAVTISPDGALWPCGNDTIIKYLRFRHSSFALQSTYSICNATTYVYMHWYMILFSYIMLCLIHCKSRSQPQLKRFSLVNRHFLKEITLSWLAQVLIYTLATVAAKEYMIFPTVHIFLYISG